MSRILWANWDDRPMPPGVCWWRLPLRPNADGNCAVTQGHVPDPWDQKTLPWLAHVDYFDGRDDWSWPFAHRLTPVPTLPTLLAQVWKEAHIAVHYYHLDVLDIMPPAMDGGWRQLTEFYDHRHPDDRPPRWT